MSTRVVTRHTVFLEDSNEGLGIRTAYRKSKLLTRLHANYVNNINYVNITVCNKRDESTNVTNRLLRFYYHLVYDGRLFNAEINLSLANQRLLPNVEPPSDYLRN